MKDNRSAQSSKSSGKTLSDASVWTLTDTELETVAGGVFDVILDIWQSGTDRGCEVRPKHIRPEKCDRTSL